MLFVIYVPRFTQHNTHTDTEAHTHTLYMHTHYIHTLYGYTHSICTHTCIDIQTYTTCIHTHMHRSTHSHRHTTCRQQIKMNIYYDLSSMVHP